MKRFLIAAAALLAPVSAAALTEDDYSFCAESSGFAETAMLVRQISGIPAYEMSRIIMDAAAEAEREGKPVPMEYLRAIALGTYEYVRSFDPEEQRQIGSEYSSLIYILCLRAHSGGQP